MTLQEIAYMILEAIRENEIMDDENIDVRLVYDWIDMKRAQYIKNQQTKNLSGRLNLNLYQKITLDLDIVGLEDAGDYPFYTPSITDSQIIRSTEAIPSIIEGRGGPLILSIESENNMQYPYSIVDYDALRFVGNGKFNSNLVFTAIRDNYVWFKYNSNLEYFNTIVIRALFEKPREVNGYSVITDRYPANLGLIEYIKNGIFDTDIKVIFGGKRDDVNNADGTVA